MILVLDLDETLITDSGRCDKYGEASLKPIRVEYNRFWADDIYVRPYCKEFLVWANTHFEKVILCTFSTRDRVRIILRELGFKKYFNDVFTHEDISCLKLELDDFVLVDDCSWNDDLLLDKLRFLGVEDLPKKIESVNVIDYLQIPDVHVHIKRFVGDELDSELLRVKKVLKKALGIS